MQKYSRRGFAGLILAPFVPAACLHSQSTPAAPAVPPAPDPAETATAPPARIMSRKYRADAAILVFGISLYRRAGVGGGQASLEETGEGASLRRTLFFAGSSDPKRAHGLRRVGWIREAVLGPGAAPSEATYFGVLTSSPEESLEHARKSVDAPPSGLSLFSASSGRHTPGHSRSAITHFEFAADAIWSDRGLIERAQSTFRANANVNWHETSWTHPPNGTPATFLFQLATLLKQGTGRARGRYVYNEQEYLLEVEAPSTRNDERLLPVRGKIRNLGTNHETDFRLWLEGASDSIVPVRIEFQARSFLRLTFEALAA